MFDAMHIGATGMQAQQLNVDTIANNIVNLNTVGFKKARVSFTDLVTSETNRTGSAAALSNASEETGPLASIPMLGSGVGVSNVLKMFDMGSLNQTGSMWDLAIQGDGFIQIAQPDGTTAYWRGGSLKITTDGVLATQSGQVLKPSLAIPSNATSLSITSDGVVSATLPNQTSPTQIGQLQLVRFSNPGLLLAQGDGVYHASEGSGEPIAGTPGQDGIGTLQQGFVEGSNVKMVDEMINLMMAQRNYQASLKVVQASDELLAMVNNLRK